MPTPPDKRRRSDLDLFILALIEDGLSTQFEFEKMAGLSQGATALALRRLRQARLVRQDKPGKRGKVVYAITTAGRSFLGTETVKLLSSGPSGDLESNLRVALLAMRSSGSCKESVSFLNRSAELRLQGLDQGSHVSEESVPVALAFWYSTLRSKSRCALREVEASSLRLMAKSLPRLIRGKSTPIAASSKKRRGA